MSSDHNEYIRSQIKAAKNRIGIQSVPILPASERPKFLTHFLIVCILLVSVATVYGIWSKNNQPVVSKPAPIYITQDQMSGLMSSIDGRLSNIESSAKIWNNRVWLLGIAHNDTIGRIKDDKIKYHPGDPADYISFERNWTINRMPNNMKLEPSDEEMLRKNLK